MTAVHEAGASPRPPLARTCFGKDQLIAVTAGTQYAWGENHTASAGPSSSSSKYTKTQSPIHHNDFNFYPFFPRQSRAVCFSTLVILGQFSSCFGGELSNHGHQSRLGSGRFFQEARSSGAARPLEADGLVGQGPGPTLDTCGPPFTSLLMKW